MKSLNRRKLLVAASVVLVTGCLEDSQNGETGSSGSEDDPNPDEETGGEPGSNGSDDDTELPWDEPAVLAFNIEQPPEGAVVGHTDEGPVAESDVVVETVAEAIKTRDKNEYVRREIRTEAEFERAIRAFDYLLESQSENREEGIYGPYVEHDGHTVILRFEGVDSSSADRLD
jgi:hypothetical protein